MFPSISRAEDQCTANFDVKPPHQIQLDDVFQGRRGTSFPISELAPRPYAPGEIRTEFAGIEGIIVRRAQSYYNRYANRYLQDYYAQSNMNPCEWDRFLDRLWGRGSLQFYRRSFYESMVPEKGGAGPTVVETIGSTHEIINLFGLSLFSDGRIKTGELRFFIDSMRQLPSQDPYALLDNSIIRKTRVVGGVQFEERARFDRFEFAFRPNVTFRLGPDLDLNALVSSVSVTTKLKIYSRLRKHTPLVVITTTASYEPPRRFFAAACVVEVLCW